MEGLIPFLIHVIRKPKPRPSFRSFSHNSDTSNRSYHLLLGSDGSSHRRTRSDFLPPSAEFLEQRYGADGFLVSPRGPLRAASPTVNAAKAATSHPLQFSHYSNNIRK